MLLIAVVGYDPVTELRDIRENVAVASLETAEKLRRRQRLGSKRGPMPPRDRRKHLEPVEIVARLPEIIAERLHQRGLETASVQLLRQSLCH